MNPSLDELKARQRQDQMEAHRSSLEARARRFGFEVKPGEDIWKLVRRVHDAQDDRDWPGVARKAERLGIRIYDGFGPFKKRRWITTLKLAIYDEEDHRKLLRRYGYSER